MGHVVVEEDVVVVVVAVEVVDLVVTVVVEMVVVADADGVKRLGVFPRVDEMPLPLVVDEVTGLAEFPSVDCRASHASLDSSRTSTQSAKPSQTNCAGMQLSPQSNVSS